jgi:hypothetical protein
MKTAPWCSVRRRRVDGNPVAHLDDLAAIVAQRPANSTVYAASVYPARTPLHRHGLPGRSPGESSVTSMLGMEPANIEHSREPFMSRGTLQAQASFSTEGSPRARHRVAPLTIRRQSAGNRPKQPTVPGLRQERFCWPANYFEPVSGFEPLTVRLQEALLPFESSGTANCASPSCLHYGWSELTNLF